MNEQINFIMTENDEKKFMDFIYKSNCTVRKYVLLDNEKPTNMYKCLDRVSLRYCILDNDSNIDDIYTEIEFDGNTVKLFEIMNADFSAKPVILFTRGRFNFGVGRLYVNTEMMDSEEKVLIKNKYKIIKKWIIKNSNHVIKIGWTHRIYLLPEASEQYKKNKSIFHWH